MNLAQHTRLLCLLILGATSYACGSQSPGLKGTMGTGTSSDIKSDDKKGSTKTAPATQPIANSPFVPQEDEENVIVTVPGNIAGTYLRCPALESVDRVLRLGCTFSDRDSNQKLNIAPLLTDTNWSTKNAPSSVRIQTETLPLNSAWSELVSLEFASPEDLETYKSSIRIVFSGRIGDNDNYIFESNIDVTPGSAGTRTTLRSLNLTDQTFMGSFETQPKTGFHQHSIGMLAKVSSIRDQWTISASKKIRNPLGYCMRIESRYHTADYVDCADSKAIQVELSSGMIRILNGGSDNLCLTLATILDQDKASAPSVKHFVNSASCSPGDINQIWTYASF